MGLRAVDGRGSSHTKLLSLQNCHTKLAIPFGGSASQVMHALLSVCVWGGGGGGRFSLGFNEC